MVANKPEHMVIPINTPITYPNSTLNPENTRAKCQSTVHLDTMFLAPCNLSCPLPQRETRIPLEVREIDHPKLYVADEAFFRCGNYSEIEPIVSANRYLTRYGSISPITRQLRAPYRNVVFGSMQKYHA